MDAAGSSLVREIVLHRRQEDRLGSPTGIQSKGTREGAVALVLPFLLSE